MRRGQRMGDKEQSRGIGEDGRQGTETWERKCKDVKEGLKDVRQEQGKGTEE
jgi:hypothetical protein